MIWCWIDGFAGFSPSAFNTMTFSLLKFYDHKSVSCITFEASICVPNFRVRMSVDKIHLIWATLNPFDGNTLSISEYVFEWWARSMRPLYWFASAIVHLKRPNPQNDSMGHMGNEANSITYNFISFISIHAMIYVANDKNAIETTMKPWYITLWHFNI